MNAIGYIRISKRDQSNYSLEFQEDRIREYCTRNKVDLVAIYKDDGECSYSFDRPDYLALEAFIKAHKGKVQYLIIWDHDRFSRNLPEALTKIEQLEKKYGMKVLECAEPLDLDTSDPNVFISRAFKYLMANAELFRIRKRVKNGIRQAQQSGRFVHVAPFGYINSRDGSGRSMLLIDESKAFIIQKIFRDYLNGVPKFIIHADARQLGYNVNGSSAIARTLSNPTYAGLVKVAADKAEPERVVKGVHQAIINEDQYWLVQEKLGIKRVAKSQPKEEFILRGVIVSPCCGSLMTAGWSKGKSRYYLYYRCVRHNNVNIPGKVMHEKFEQLIAHLDFTGEQLAYLISKMKASINESGSVRLQQQQAKEKNLAEIEKKIDKLEERLMNDEIESDTYKKYFKKFNSEKMVLKEEINHLKAGNSELMTAQFEQMKHLLCISAIFKKAEISQQHVFLKRVFKHSLTFIEGVFRTPWIHSLFEHNLLIMKQKRLLFLEQPDGNFGGIPRGGAGGICIARVPR
ncbi:recombinase family protein [Mucilaginibacter sp. BJC16-A38]|uniref:recombinase family protein n=1 Tax=Mucilaginibacter phenanthrenivorans TaxID=1234842 RepID=UPI002156F75F|nr:recombinase family protein [Mucilaginibacter phenanthrenivorans]MCR8560468.1 recombinase family protein [Mucilaginibacter phenanthrenivorans]